MCIKLRPEPPNTFENMSSSQSGQPSLPSMASATVRGLYVRECLSQVGCVDTARRRLIPNVPSWKGRGETCWR